MDIVPLENLEPMEDNSYLSERAIWARQREIERRLSRPNRKETMLDQARASFELIGGVPRLAAEGDEQPWELYKLLARLEQAEKAKTVNHNVRIIQPSLPPTTLDGAIDAEFQDVTTQPE